MAEDGKELYDGGIELEILVLIHYLKKYIYILALQLERAQSNDTPIAISTELPRSCFFKYHSPIKGAEDSWRKS